MIDLQPLMRKAMAAKGAWDLTAVEAALRTLAAWVPDGHVDWEDGDEEWGRVLSADGTPVALVCGRMPLGILRACEAESVDLPKDVVWIELTDLSEPAFRVDQRFLETAFGRELSENVDYGSLSAQELWWVTV